MNFEGGPTRNPTNSPSRDTDPGWEPFCVHQGTPTADILPGTPGQDLMCDPGGPDRITGSKVTT